MQATRRPTLPRWGNASESPPTFTLSPNGPISSVMANRRPSLLGIIGLLAAIAVSLSLLLSGGFLQAQEASIALNYNENDTTPVIRLVSGDPENVTPTDWAILDALPAPVPMVGGIALTGDDIEDEEHFTINSDGELTFAIDSVKDASPNFEDPQDNTPADNVYRVTVESTDRGLEQKKSWFKVTVRVMDVEEEGEITWMVDPDGDGVPETAQNLLQFQAGADLDASLTDPDGAAVDAPTTQAIEDANITWRWYRASSRSDDGTVITDDQDNPEAGASYRVQDTSTNNDVGKYLRVVAMYSDRRGGRKMAEFVSAHPVQESRLDNTAPEFDAATADREVAETTPSGTAIGSPVTADDPDGDILNYFRTDDTAGDNEKFSVDQATGQIKTVASAEF